MTVSYLILIVCSSALGITASRSLIDGNKVGLVASAAGIVAAISSTCGA